MDPVEIQEFFLSQLAGWSDCKRRYDDLGTARRRKLEIDGREYTLIYNQARMRSATAKVTAGKVDRPCFLCRDNRPKEQRDIIITPDGSPNTYRLSVNPYPILPYHFTIINDGHCRQTMTPERLRDMAQIAKAMEGYLVFFNGACSGASAPDHFHFQAVPRELVPLANAGEDTFPKNGIQVCAADDVRIEYSGSDFTNILCWRSPSGLCWKVIRRRCHRPWQYSAEGEEKVLISPASLEFAGVVPLAREEDYEKISADTLRDIFSQCLEKEPIVEVGLCRDDVPVSHNPDGTFTLHGVRIGIGFHWDQRRQLTYEGETALRKDPDTGERWIINRLGVERYLQSVISSEMSATSSLELLKAHAVISRSWLMRQIMMKGTTSDYREPAAPAAEEATGRIIRWYDSHAHTFFDVCADDHCQRYQGISPKMNPVVAEAIKQTRGEVLMYGGEICDARFSKCCGGMTEEYRYCWESINVPYLSAVPDTRPDGSVYCDTHDSAILGQVLNDYDLSTQDFYSWQVDYTQEELSRLVEERLHLGLGRILGLEALERGPGGRISLLRITGEERSVEIGKELEIRKALSRTHLYSSAFETLTHEEDGVRKFTLKGRGWGHGVGLCQIGAAVMGAEGKDYKTILAHYYKNAEIRKIW